MAGRPLEQHELLVGDERPQLLWTDPPYGVEYVGKTKRKLRIEGDGPEDLEALLAGAFACADPVLADGARIYVAHPAAAGAVMFASPLVTTGTFTGGASVVRKLRSLGFTVVDAAADPVASLHTNKIYSWGELAQRFGSARAT